MRVKIRRSQYPPNELLYVKVDPSAVTTREPSPPVAFEATNSDVFNSWQYDLGPAPSQDNPQMANWQYYASRDPSPSAFQDPPLRMAQADDLFESDAYMAQMLAFCRSCACVTAASPSCP